MLAAASSRSARDDTADSAELPPSFVGHSEARLTLLTLECWPFDIAARAWARSTLRSIRLRCYACGANLGQVGGASPRALLGGRSDEAAGPRPRRRDRDHRPASWAIRLADGPGRVVLAWVLL